MFTLSRFIMTTTMVSVLLSVLLLPFLPSADACGGSIRSAAASNNPFEEEDHHAAAPQTNRFPHPRHLADPHGVGDNNNHHEHHHSSSSSSGKQRRGQAILSCGTPPMSLEDLQFGELNADNFWQSILDFFQGIWNWLFPPSGGGGGGGGNTPRTSFTVPTYYFVISRSDGSSPSPSRATVERQHQVLTNAYGGSGFTFQNRGVQFITNDDWYGYRTFNSQAELQMKTELRQGGPETLNVYINDAIGFCGYAYFPSEYQQYPIWDGVVINDECFVDGPNPAKQGDTLVHEVGHWLGVPHTFEGGCSGDGIDDTPDHETPTTGCPVVAPDTCPSRPGSDPVTNFMNYADDGCRSEFTEGQRKRMVAEYSTYRA